MTDRAAQSMTERRAELVERSAAQRRAIAGHVDPLVRQAAALDRIVSRVRQYPVMTALVLGGVALLSTRRIFGVATRILTLYALIKR